MESKHQELLERQEAVTQAIRKICTNFSKDSAHRKTSNYLKVRLDSLQALWDEFDMNNTVLQGARNKTNEYFTTQAYEKTKTDFITIKQKLESCKPYDASETSEGESEREAGGLSKTDELKTLQGTNFRAFSRFIRNLNINLVTEKWEIEDKLRTLQSRWKVIDDVHWQIDNLLIGSDVDRELEFSKYEAIYEKTKRALSSKLNSAIQQCESAPKIEIPIFSGNYSQWPTFLDLYSEAIHKNPSIPKARKMQHLKGKLRGEAERLVQHLSVSADNYDSCWEILNHRYNNIQLLFTNQMQAFMNQPTIQHQSAHELKRLHDTSLETIHAIHNLGVDATTWDPILVYILTQKLDAQTYSDYMEARTSPRELPTFQEFIQFIEGKFTALEPLARKKQASVPYKKEPNNQNKESPSASPSNQFNKFKRYPKTYHASISRNCPICKEGHILIICKSFQEMSPDTKMKTIEQHNICINCLFPHNGNKCYSNKRCKVCNIAHHTTLHDVVRDTTPLLTSSGQQPPNSPVPPLQGKANHVSGNFNEVLLATTQLRIRAADGTYITLRCLLDQGSQINIITESAAQRLGLQRQNQNSTVSGIGSTTNQSNGTVHLQCESLYGDYKFTTQALVMVKMLNNLPNYSFEKQDWPHVQSINLADPDYNVSRAVDILLDAGVYADIIMSGILRGPIHAPIAQQTKLGWVLVGNTKTFNCHTVLVNHEDISRSREIEGILDNNSTTAEDESCEKLYTNTTKRLDDGLYEAKTPKQTFEQQTGVSKPQAGAQFRQLGQCLATSKKEGGNSFPLAADMLNNQQHVNNLLGGSSDFMLAHEAQPQLINMLKGGRFNLRKWASNNTALFQNLSENLISQNMFDFKDTETNKTLGITWNPYMDHFTYKQTPLSNKRDVITKRTLLSEHLRQKLTCFHDIEIPRCIGNILKPIELHGFCDSSERAFACILYSKSSDDKALTTIKLAKTKSAPLKKSISLPRLELSGAAAPSRLMKKVIDTTSYQTVTLHGWTKSMVVMGWLQGDISCWKTFIANRTTQIKESIPSSCWRHVKFEESRGLNPSHIIVHALWRSGPSWLKSNNLPGSGTFTTTEEEKKNKQVCVTQTKAPLVLELLDVHSSMTRVTRVLSWVMRFVNAHDINQAKRTSYLTTADIETAHNIISKTVQQINFAEDISQLHKHNKVRSTSNILNLNPILDKNQVMRVGGRLQHLNPDQQQIHPYIVPSRHKLTELLIDQSYKTTLHGGGKLTLVQKLCDHGCLTTRRRLQERDNNTMTAEEQLDSIKSNTMTAKSKRQLRSATAKMATFTTYLSTLFVLLIACVGPSTQQLVNVTTLEPTRLIYFDKVADMQIIQEEWKMIVYYNMSTYWKSVTYIEQYVDHLQSLCKKKLAFLTIASQFAHELNELKHYNQMLLSEHGSRTKRGLVNGIGYLANSLFGVLDDRFAEKYNKDIKLLQGDQSHLLTLYKQHTSIIEGEYNLLKRNEQLMNHQFIIINKHLRESEQRFKMEQDKEMYVTATALTANMIITNLRRVQETIWDLVTDVRNGKVDTHLLKPDAFENQLNIISGQVPKGLSLPCTSSHKCTRKMYRLSRVHVKMIEDFILFEVKIPLVANEQYELTKVIPINNITGETMIHVVPTAEYLAINLQKDMLVPMKQQDLSTCVHFNKNNLLCTLNIPIYEIKTNSLCEARIINNQEAPASGCRTEISNCKDEWTNLHSRTAWLFTCCEECSVRIFCPAGLTSQKLRNTGIINLSNGCVLRGEHHLIHAHYNLQSEMKTENEEMYAPKPSINELISTNNNMSLYDMQPVSQDEELKILKNKIAQVKEQQETLTIHSLESDPHHYVLYGFIIFCGLAFGIWCCLKLKATCTSCHRGETGQRKVHESSEQIEMEEITVPPEEPRQMRTVTRVISLPTARPKVKKMDSATSPIPFRGNK